MILRYFRVDVEPRGQGRPRFRTIPVTQNGVRKTLVNAYKAKEDKAYEEEIKQAYLATYGGIRPLESPLVIEILAYLPIPKSTPRKRKQDMRDGFIAPTKKPDTDNIAKAVLDALNGVAWVDDRQICALKVMKEFESDKHAVGIDVYIRVMDMCECV